MLRFKVSHYSTERLKREYCASNHRLHQYFEARECFPSSSILGSLAISAGIKYEEELLAALVEEMENRGVAPAVE